MMWVVGVTPLSSGQVEVSQGSGSLSSQLWHHASSEWDAGRCVAGAEQSR